MRDRIRPHLVPVLVLAVLTVAVYVRCLGHDFIAGWDDDLYVRDNPAVRGLSADHLHQAFSQRYGGNYAPLQIVSYMIDYTLWGMRPGGFVVSNILLHLLNGLLFYGILVRLHGRRAVAFAASFLFLLHPVQVESVAWISQRKNVLAMFLFLVAFGCYSFFREARERRTRRLLYAGSVVAFLGALLSKSVAVVLLPVLLLYDRCFPGEGRQVRMFRDKVPFLLAACLFAALTVYTQSHELGGGRRGYHGGSPLVTAMTMVPVFLQYLLMLVKPTGLAAVYMPALKQGIDGEVAAGLAVLGVCCWAGYWLWRRRRDLCFWYALFWLGLVPVSQVVPLVTLMNDRYLYFPLLGAAALGGFAVAQAWDARRSPVGRLALAGCAAALLAVPLLSYARAGVWRNDFTLWNDAVAKVPGNHVAWQRLGDAYSSRGESGLAMASYRRALAIDPEYGDALYGIGVLYASRGDLAAARGFLLRFTERWPRQWEGFVALGHTYYQEGRHAEAADAYRRALALHPGAVDARAALGNIALGARQLHEARRQYHGALAAGGATAQVYYGLACVESLSGNRAEGLRYLERSLILGYRDFGSLARNPELDGLRQDPEFDRLVRRFTHG